MTRYTTTRKDRIIGEIILRLAQLGVGIIFIVGVYMLLSLSIIAEQVVYPHWRP